MLELSKGSECMTIGQRVKKVRNELNLTMQDFGNKIGIGKGAVSNIENGYSNPSTSTLKFICKQFNVDYFWLTEGKGEMFVSFPEFLIDEIVEQYGMTDIERRFLIKFANADKEKRKLVLEYLEELFNELSNK